MSKVAVIGSGYWGKNLVRGLSELDALAAVCDKNTELLNQFESKYKVRTTTDLKSVLDDSAVSGVAIATPAVTHHRIVTEALEAGKDVFVEKPLSLTVGEGRTLARLAKTQKRILMVGHILQYHPAVIKLKEALLNDELGKIQFIHSSRLNIGKVRSEENILWSFAPHDISVILSLVGESPRNVQAFGGDYLQAGIYDTSFTTLEFASGVKAQLFVSWLHPFKEQKLVVVGEKQMAVFDDMAKDKLVFYPHRIEWLNNAPVAQKAEGVPISLETREPLKEELKEFLECMHTRRMPKTDAEEGLRVLDVIERAERSLISKKAGLSMSNISLSDVFVHPSAVVDHDAHIGKGSKIWHFSHISSGVEMGENCILGQNVFIADGVKMGNRCKVQNNVSLYKGVILEDNVFCGPSCVFTNVINPRAHIERKSEYKPTVVKTGATIGANATILCGHTIGSFSLIGAGAVVTKDVPDYALMLGVPAEVAGWVCACGSTLHFEKTRRAACAQCENVYELKGNRVRPLTQTQSSMAPATVPILDLKRGYLHQKRAIDQAIETTLRHQQWILGPEVRAFEERCAQYLGASYTVGVGSGTDALVLALRALALQRTGKEYFDRADEIVTTSFTFTATGDAILRAGATPVFVDIDPRTLTIDAGNLKKAINPKTVGIIPVHLYGRACEMDDILSMARAKNLFVVEDVAQAFGGKWHGKALGTLGNAGAFSFFPSKNLGAFGDGGLVATQDQALAELVRMLSKHGGKDKYNVDHIGYNSRLDTLQAAVLLMKLDQVEDWNTRRAKVAQAYLSGLKGVREITLPTAAPDHVFHQFTIRSSERDALAQFLKTQGVQTMVYYPTPLHKMKVFAGRSRVSGSLTQTELACREVLSLPIDPLLESSEIDRVVKAIKQFTEKHPAAKRKAAAPSK